jgi:mono/diheme cytochrome c family protein
MKINNYVGVVLAGTLLLAGSSAMLVGKGGGAEQEKQTKEIKKVPVPHSKPESGAQMYQDYCAACHGKEGKGNGPVVEFLKAPPPDLTTMARRNGGKFPGESVTTTLLFGAEKHPHGTSDMPIWGPLFRSLQGSKVTDPLIKLRIANLTSYLESLQSK